MLLIAANLNQIASTLHVARTMAASTETIKTFIFLLRQLSVVYEQSFVTIKQLGVNYNHFLAEILTFFVTTR